MCSWRAILGQEVVHGEHYIRDIAIRPLTFFQGCPVVATAEHAATMEHDFSHRPAALVPLKLRLKNIMLETPVQFSWAWDASNPQASSSSSSFELIGTCEQRLELEPKQEVEIPLKVLIPAPGVHDLQVLRFVVHHSGKNGSDQRGDVTHHLSQQWLINLVDSSAATE